MSITLHGSTLGRPLRNETVGRGRGVPEVPPNVTHEPRHPRSTHVAATRLRVVEPLNALGGQVEFTFMTTDSDGRAVIPLPDKSPE